MVELQDLHLLLQLVHVAFTGLKPALQMVQLEALEHVEQFAEQAKREVF